MSNTDISSILEYFPDIDVNNIKPINTYIYLAHWVKLYKDENSKRFYVNNEKTEEWKLSNMPPNYHEYLSIEEVEELSRNKDCRYKFSILDTYESISICNIKYVFKAFDFIDIYTYYRDISTEIYYKSYDKQWEITTNNGNLFNSYEEFLADKLLRS